MQILGVGPFGRNCQFVLKKFAVDCRAESIYLAILNVKVNTFDTYLPYKQLVNVKYSAQNGR